MRLDRLTTMIGECELGIHDFSRVRRLLRRPSMWARETTSQAISAAGLDPKPMGPTKILALYNDFQTALPGITAKADLTLADIEPLSAFNDWYLLATRRLQQQAASQS